MGVAAHEVMLEAPAEQGEAGVEHDAGAGDVGAEKVVAFAGDKGLHELGIEIVEKVLRMLLSSLARGTMHVHCGAVEHLQSAQGACRVVARALPVVACHADTVSID